MSSANIGATSATEAQSGGVRRCARCAHFHNDRAWLEASFPGLTAMSSGDASVRADDGLCERHGVYLSARDSCAEFVAARP